MTEDNASGRDDFAFGSGGQLEYDQLRMEDGVAPPSSGGLNLVLPMAPVSLQARRAKKDAVTAAVRSITQNSGFLLTGDVQIDIEWLLHERDRYESGTSPDIDNIVKPLLDAACGPDGILIDDCQVQAVSCHWIDWTREDQQVTIRIKFMPDEWTIKEGLQFVHMGDGLCLPVNRNLPAPGLLMMLEVWEKQFSARNKLLELTGDYYAAQQVMSVQRVFRKTRLSRFEVVEFEDLTSEARSRLQESGA